METWKTITDFPNYAISSYGRVKSMARVVVRKHKDGKTVEQPLSEMILSPAKNPKTGYLHVSLRKEGASYSRHVHKLVAQAFVPGEAPGLDVCHNDGNQENNVPSNLRWDTRKSNLGDTDKHGTKLFGAKQNGAKLTDALVRSLRVDRENGHTWGEIAERYNISSMTAHAAGTGKTWKHLNNQHQANMPVPSVFD